MSSTKRKPKQFVREGATYGRLTVLGVDHERTVWGKRFFRCQCSCGNRLTVYGPSLTSGNTTSCGCFHRERNAELARANKTTHGQSCGHRKTKLYDCYVNMMRRCYDPKCKMFPRYGGRGITICARWRSDRAAFFTDMGTPPSPDHSIDRIKNQRGYWCGKPECPECGPAGHEPNCRWTDAATQSLNRSSNKRLTCDNRTMTMKEWSVETGIPYSVIQCRVARGWTDERVLTEPIRKVKRR